VSTPKPTAPPAAERAALALEAWKKVVQTQEHFNEICMKVRTLYATVLAAILSLYGVILREPLNQSLHISGLSVDPFMAVCAAIFSVTTLFYFVDKEWYHRLLLGAVDQGIEIEKRWGDLLPEIQLGSKISNRSPVDLSSRPFIAWILKIFVRDKRLRKGGKLHSDAKIEVFYKPIQGLSLFIFAIAFFCGGLKFDGNSVINILWFFLRGICST